MSLQIAVPNPFFLDLSPNSGSLFLFAHVCPSIFEKRMGRNPRFRLPQERSKKRVQKMGSSRRPRMTAGGPTRPQKSSPKWSQNDFKFGFLLFWSLLGPTWASLVPSWPLWVPILAPSCPIMGPPWGNLGPSWGQLGTLVRLPGPSWCPSCPPSCHILGPSLPRDDYGRGS